MKKNKAMSINELDVVSGGTIIESYHIGFMLKDAGYDVFESDGKFMNMSKFRKVLTDMGVSKIDDHGGIFEANSYTVGGKTLNNDQMIDFLKSKGIKDAGAAAYSERWLKGLGK